MQTHLFLLFLLATLATGCGAYPNGPPYDFADPRRVLTMPPELAEISGLAPLDWQFAAGVDDETGKFFVIDMSNGRIVREQDFGPDGDYEDLVRLGATLYILEGNGALHVVPNMRTHTPKTERFDTGVRNAEGLAHFPRSRRLLIGGIHVTDRGDTLGAVFRYDMRDHLPVAEPFMTVSMDQVRALLGAGAASVEGIDEPVYKPSALAVQPGTLDIYLISAKVHAILIANRDGELQAAFPLPPDIFPEPEGLAFLPNGELFISNEEHGGKPATLVRLKHRRAAF